jgi:hypothetical protein
MTRKNECPECGESDECKWDNGKCWTCGYCADDDEAIKQDSENV